MNKELKFKNKDVGRILATSVVVCGLLAVVATVGAFTDTTNPAPSVNKGGPIHQGLEYNVFPGGAEGQYKLGGLSVGSGTGLLPGEFLGIEHPSGTPSLVVTAGKLKSGGGDSYLNGNVTIGSPERVVVPQGGGLGQIVPEYKANLRVYGAKGSDDPINYNAVFSELKHCSSTAQPVCVNDGGKLFLCDVTTDISCLGQGSQDGGE